MQTTKYYKLRIGSEIGILLEFFLNAFKYLTVSISTEIVILAIAPLLFISVGIFCELAVLPDVYVLVSPQEKWGQIYTSGSTFIKNIETCHHISMPK